MVKIRNIDKSSYGGKHSHLIADKSYPLGMMDFFQLKEYTLKYCFTLVLIEDQFHFSY